MRYVGEIDENVVNFASKKWCVPKLSHPVFGVVAVHSQERNGDENSKEK